MSITVSNSYATGNVTVSTDTYCVGGFVGASGTMTCNYCYSTGDIACTADSYIGLVGGFTGDGGTAYSCYSTSQITAICNYHPDTPGTIEYIGGFAGGIATVNDCYCWSKITASIDGAAETDYTNGYMQYIGGFAGYATSAQNVYAVTPITLSLIKRLSAHATYGTIQHTGAVFGGAATVLSSYWDKEATGLTADSDAVGLTTAEAKTRRSYANWDFDYVWEMPQYGAISVCVTPSTGEDRVTVAVSRIIQGARVLFIERMATRAFTQQKDAFFVDCGKTFTGSTTNSVAGLEHLEGEKVKVLGDGAYAGEFTVTQGTVNLPDSFSTIHVGLPFTYKLKPNRLDDENTRDMVRMIHKITVSLLNSLNVKYGRNFDTLYDIDFRVDEPYTTPPALFTGDKEVSFDGGFAVDDPILIAGNDPMPCTVRALVVKMSVTGR